MLFSNANETHCHDSYCEKCLNRRHSEQLQQNTLNIKTTVEFRISGFKWSASYPDMQKIRIIGFFFEKKAKLVV
jgi:hypothetical protein